MIHRDYLIVGAGIAGASVCEAIRKRDRRGSIMLVGSESFAPYNRPHLFRSFLTKAVTPPENLLHVKPEWYAAHKIDLRLETAVIELNLEKRVAVLATGQAVEFRKACLAMGSRAKRPGVAGASLGNVVCVRTLRDVTALREISGGEKNVVVIGGGFIAAETASLLRQLRLNVRLMSRYARLWQKTLDEETATWLTDYFTKRGVDMMMQETLNGFEGKTVLKNIQTKSGNRFSAGMALVAVGAEPNLDLVANTPLSGPNGTPVNEYLETDEKGVYAAGDIALYPDRIFGGVRRTEHWENALVQGRLVGGNITGRKRQKFENIPYNASELFDLKFEFIGDFSAPPSRVELHGERAKKKFSARYFRGDELRGVLLCNQEASAAASARKLFRE